MIVRRFLLWARTASAGARAEAVSALARAYLYSEMSGSDRADAEAAMAATLDDPSPLVRQALAEAFANAADAPYHLVIPLAHDQPDIAALVLSRSPVLHDSDLVDCAAIGGELAQIAVAMRPRVSAAVAAAIAEIGTPTALAVLAGNHAAEINPASLARMVERHGSDGALREALLQREDLPINVRLAVAEALSTTLAGYALECGWLPKERAERITRESQERAAVTLAAEAPLGEMARLVAYLRDSGRLTPLLILRAVLSRADDFVAAVMADLSGLPLPRVAAMIAERRSAGVIALYRRAGLPSRLEPLFEAAFAAASETSRDAAPRESGRVSRQIVLKVLAACRTLEDEETGRLLAILRRFEAEAAREESRVLVETLADEAALAAVLQYAPETLCAERALRSVA